MRKDRLFLVIALKDRLEVDAGIAAQKTHTSQNRQKAERACHCHI